jgi:hypothetical protein
MVSEVLDDLHRPQFRVSGLGFRVWGPTWHARQAKPPSLIKANTLACSEQTFQALDLHQHACRETAVWSEGGRDSVFVRTDGASWLTVAAILNFGEYGGVVRWMTGWSTRLTLTIVHANQAKPFTKNSSLNRSKTKQIEAKSNLDAALLDFWLGSNYCCFRNDQTINYERFKPLSCSFQQFKTEIGIKPQPKPVSLEPKPKPHWNPRT